MTAYEVDMQSLVYGVIYVYSWFPGYMSVPEQVT